MGNVTISATTANACGCCGAAAPEENCCTANYTYTGDSGTGSASGLTLSADTFLAGGAPGLSISWDFQINIAAPALLTFTYSGSGTGPGTADDFSASTTLFDPSDNEVTAESRSGSNSPTEFICNANGCYYGFHSLSLISGVEYFQADVTASSNAAIYCNTFTVAYGG